MPFITGGDWSVGLNSRTSLQQVDMLNLLGRGLQSLYDDLIQEGVPEHLAEHVERLEQNDDGGAK